MAETRSQSLSDVNGWSFFVDAHSIAARGCGIDSGGVSRWNKCRSSVNRLLAHGCSAPTVTLPSPYDTDPDAIVADLARYLLGQVKFIDSPTHETARACRLALEFATRVRQSSLALSTYLIASSLAGSTIDLIVRLVRDCGFPPDAGAEIIAPHLIDVHDCLGTVVRTEIAGVSLQLERIARLPPLELLPALLTLLGVGVAEIYQPLPVAVDSISTLLKNHPEPFDLTDTLDVLRNLEQWLLNVIAMPVPSNESRAPEMPACATISPLCTALLRVESTCAGATDTECVRLNLSSIRNPLGKLIAYEFAPDVAVIYRLLQHEAEHRLGFLAMHLCSLERQRGSLPEHIAVESAIPVLQRCNDDPLTRQDFGYEPGRRRVWSRYREVMAECVGSSVVDVDRLVISVPDRRLQ